MTDPDPKADLRSYLQAAREAMLWKLDGLSEYDVRRPLVRTGSNLLGLIKHQAGVEFTGVRAHRVGLVRHDVHGEQVTSVVRHRNLPCQFLTGLCCA